MAPTRSALAKQNQVIASPQKQPTLWHSLEIEQAIARRMGMHKNGAVLAFTGAKLAEWTKTNLPQ